MAVCFTMCALSTGFGRWSVLRPFCSKGVATHGGLTSVQLRVSRGMLAPYWLEFYVWQLPDVSLGTCMLAWDDTCCACGALQLPLRAAEYLSPAWLICVSLHACSWGLYCSRGGQVARWGCSVDSCLGNRAYALHSRSVAGASIHQGGDSYTTFWVLVLLDSAQCCTHRQKGCASPVRPLPGFAFFE